MTVGQLREALAEFPDDLFVVMGTTDGHLSVESAGRTSDLPILTLEVDADSLSSYLSDYVEDHRGADGVCDF